MVAWKEAVAHVVEDPGNGQEGALDEHQAEAGERVQEQEPVLSSHPNNDSNLPEREDSPESGDFGNGRNQEHENGIEFRVQAQPGPSYSNHFDAMEEFDFDYDGFSERGRPQTSGNPHEQEQGPHEDQIGDGRSSWSRGDLDEDNKDEDRRVRSNETRRKLKDASLYSLRDDMSELLGVLARLKPVELLNKETRLKGTKLVTVLRKMALDLYENPAKTPPRHPTGGTIMQENLSKMFVFCKEKPRWEFFFILGDLLEGLSRQERIDVLGLMEPEDRSSSAHGEEWYYDFKPSQPKDSDNSTPRIPNLEDMIPAETAPGRKVKRSRRDSFDYYDYSEEVDVYNQEGEEQEDIDEIQEVPVDDMDTSQPPVPAKRGRGRPKGSGRRNVETPKDTSEVAAKRGRGRSRKTQNPEEDPLQSSSQSLKLAVNRNDRNCDGTAPGPSRPSNRNKRARFDITDSSEDSEDDRRTSRSSSSSVNFLYSSTRPSAPQDEMDPIDEVPAKRGRGRPRKSRSPVVSIETPGVPFQVLAKRGRGRPRKSRSPVVSIETPEDPSQVPAKRGRGRPRKYPIEIVPTRPEESTSQESPGPSSSHGAPVDETRTEEIDPIEDIGNRTEVQSSPGSFAEPLSPIQAVDRIDDDYEVPPPSQHLPRLSSRPSTPHAAPTPPQAHMDQHPSGQSSRQASPAPSSDSRPVEDDIDDIVDAPEVPPAAQHLQDPLSGPSTPRQAREDQAQQTVTVTLYDIANSELPQKDIDAAKNLFEANFMKFIDIRDFFTTAKTFWTERQSLDEGGMDCGNFLLTFFEKTRTPGTGNRGVMMDNYARVFRYHLEPREHWWTYEKQEARSNLLLTGLNREDPEVDAIIVEHEKSKEFVVEVEKRAKQLKRDGVNLENRNCDGTAPGPSNSERREDEFDNSVRESEEDPSPSGSPSTSTRQHHFQ